MLDHIGFYTLSNKRALRKDTSCLARCELLLTDKCNFSCPYCRGPNDNSKGTLPFEKANSIVQNWAKNGLKNIRFSGGEPTVYPRLLDLVKKTKSYMIKNIAISTNGSAKKEYYFDLYKAGVNDFSVSLDSCCASVGDKMAGGIKGSWDKVTNNIKFLSKLAYTTVGIVITEDNIDECIETIKFADSLNVHDIRIIPSAQYNKLLTVIKKVPDKIRYKYPILNYRITNIENGRHVRGIKKNDTCKCPLVLDDMAVANNYHFPCIIYMREHGNPIGKVGNNMMQERREWYENHMTHLDPICRKNCLDVCIDYNNAYEKDR